MAVIVDLDDETPAAHGSSSEMSGLANVKPLHHSLVAAVSAVDDGKVRDAPTAARPNPNINGFSAALSCYPIASQLASQLDLNTLHDLSRTCRQFRANLLEYRDQLVKNSLHCELDNLDAGTTLPWREQASPATGRQLTSGRVSRCARDMVSECRRCNSVVCRNCTVKPPRQTALQARHRRLCCMCSKAPLLLLMNPRSADPTTNGASLSPGSPNQQPARTQHDHPRTFTAPAFERTPCSCDPMVWLCQPCGQHLKQADTMYIRAWTWRTRHSQYLGGIGTGAGEGIEGVECGRGSECLSARIVEHETDATTTLGGTPDSPERWKGTSYHAQEIEGIGGVFKMKAKRHVRVGECVKIYEDERAQSIQYLRREVAGDLRSWCSWCERVIPGEKDLAELACARSASRGSSSASSSQ